MKTTAVAAKEDNKDAGKLFVQKEAADDVGGGAADAGKAAAAVAAVSGEQILKAIVEAAKDGEKAGKKAEAAKNPIEAAIGADEDNEDGDAEAKAFGKEEMKKDDQIAAAMVLRGMAKDGQFVLKNDANAHDDHKGTVKNAVEMTKAATNATEAAAAATGADNKSIGNVVKGNAAAAAKGGNAESVNGIAKGIKGIVDAAEKAGEEGKLKATDAAAKEDNKDAGKLFVQKKNGDVGGGAADAGKAAAAVAAVSGEQILKAIVDAAKDEAEKEGKKAGEATNPIDAAIGADGGNEAEAFDKEGMKKDDQIAAAMVLRGMAKDGQFVLKDGAHDHEAHKGTVKNAVEMIKAAKEAAAAATGADKSIGDVVEGKAGAEAKGGDKASVNGIAKGIKGIVDAAEKAGEEGKLKTTAAAGEGNKDAGKLFVQKKANGDAGGDGKAAGKAAAAVAAVSGEQILKAIVDAAKDGEKKGKKAGEATNPIDAAIGAKEDAAKAFEKMKKNDQIAAAMVLRGMAKDGQFVLKKNDNDHAHGDHEGTVKNAVEMTKTATEAATAATGADNKSIGDVVKGDAAGNAAAKAKGGEAKSVNGIAKGIKGIVEAAEKAGEEGKLKTDAAAKEDNADAGKLFVKKANAADAGGDAKDAGKAAAAVAAVSGEQILKAIVDAAGKGGDEKTGAKAGEATNPIEAAIGGDGDDEAAFKENGMKKDDQIAAAMVLRGMAKDGQFVLKNNNHAAHKGTVKNAVEMTKAATKAAAAATGADNKSIGDVVVGKDAKGGDKASVNGIAKGIKGIVEAAEKAGEEGKLNVTAAAGDEDNKDAGKLFVQKTNEGGEAADAGKAAAAVAAVSGEQILKAIVEAAKDGAKAEDATNPIDAAIGKDDGDAAAAFEENGMKKDDQIAAAMVLRGMAKDGQFVLKNDAHDDHKGTVKNAVEMTKAATTAAAAATGGGESIGDVVEGNAAAAAAKGGKAASVNGIAKGIKGIVDAAGQAGEEGKLKATAATGGGNENAGKLFVKKAGDVGGDATDAGKAAAAVAAVSGEQILKAIVEAVGKDEKEKTGAKAGEATNPIDAAIGKDNEDGDAAEAFGEKMKKDDQIAAAMVLRGMAKDGQFVLKNDANDHKDHQGTVKNAVEMTKAAKEAATAATGGADKSIGDVVKGNAAATKGGEAASVNGIAKGIKGIVEAAEKAGEEGKLKATAATGKDNKDAGKLFVQKKDAGGDATDAGKAAAAVAAVSGEQILKAIVDAAKDETEKEGKKAENAKNPIDAAIGEKEDDEA
ncbi:variable large family protein [Borreliella japonica]|uniref:variable large family protein n=1 Tax=Borreliella japonica TaxID=34095 RepID=UPI003AF00B5B